MLHSPKGPEYLIILGWYWNMGNILWPPHRYLTTAACHKKNLCHYTNSILHKAFLYNSDALKYWISYFLSVCFFKSDDGTYRSFFLPVLLCFQFLWYYALFVFEIFFSDIEYWLLCLQHLSESYFLSGILLRRCKFAQICNNLMQNRFVITTHTLTVLFYWLV